MSEYLVSKRAKIPSKVNRPLHTYTVKKIDEFLRTLDKDVLEIRNVADVFINVRKCRYSQRKIAFMNQVIRLYPNFTQPIMTLLRWDIDKNIESNLPKGSMLHLLKPYDENSPYNTTIEKEYKNFYIFIKGRTNLSRIQVETYFINLLNRLCPEEREVMMEVKDKNLEYRYRIFKDIIKEVFPNLLLGGSFNAYL